MDDENTFSEFDLKKYEDVLNEYVIIFLSGDGAQSGYNPIGRENRLKEKYKEQWEIVQSIVGSFLESMTFLIPDWEKESYEQFEHRIKKDLRGKHAFLSIEASDQIANFILYSYK